MQNGLTVELVTFKLNEGADEAAFLQAADAVMADIRQLPGYVRRELLKGDDGQWIDVVHWRSRADALAAGRSGDAACHRASHSRCPCRPCCP